MNCTHSLIHLTQVTWECPSDTLVQARGKFPVSIKVPYTEGVPAHSLNFLACPLRPARQQAETEEVPRQRISTMRNSIEGQNTIIDSHNEREICWER